jgi:peroxiredoxin
MVLSTDSLILNDQLQDMIICKSLFENFYKEDYPQESIIFMIDSVRIAAKSKVNRIIANNIHEQITGLFPTYPAPNFEIPDKTGKLNSLAQFKGKFVYLNFINPKSYTCEQELEVLKKMAAKNYELFEIVTICVCNEMNEMQKLIKENGYSWIFLNYAKKHDLLKKYNVRIYPTYYLINPEGKLIMSPAFPPTEPSFEARYFDILKGWKTELQNRKTKGLQK